jgi:hypothetical protein
MTEPALSRTKYSIVDPVVADWREGCPTVPVRPAVKLLAPAERRSTWLVAA